MPVWSEINISNLENFKDFSADYYKKDNLLLSSILRKHKTVFLKKQSFITDGEHGSPEWDSKSNIRYITAEFIGPNYIRSGEMKTITKKQDDRNARARVQKSDVLIYSVGAYAGLTAKAEPHLFPANIPRSVAIVRLNQGSDLNPGYLSVFLNSKYGTFQSFRLRAGNSQPVLALEKIKQFEIPLIDSSYQIEIDNLYERSYQARVRSQSLYSQAQEILKRELGLDKLVFDKPLSYEAKLSEVVSNNRADAEFYHIKYKPLLNLIENYNNGHLPLYKLSTEIVPNIDLRKESGFFDYIEIGDINTSDGSYTQRRLKVNDLPANAKIKLSGGELIISQVRPTRGAISIITDELTHPTICSGAFYTCRINESTNREVIWLYIRIIKNVFEKYCGGTSYPTIDSYYLRKFPVPIFDKELAERVKTLIASSKEARDESRLLLEQAKHRVEELIEQAVNK